MKRGIIGFYHPHSNSQKNFYSFRISLEENLDIEGRHYKTTEDRDREAMRVAKELNIILVNGPWGGE
jgi:hypothetical protein